MATKPSTRRLRHRQPEKMPTAASCPRRESLPWRRLVSAVSAVSASCCVAVLLLLPPSATAFAVRPRLGISSRRRPEPVSCRQTGGHSISFSAARPIACNLVVLDALPQGMSQSTATNTRLPTRHVRWQPTKGSNATSWALQTAVTHWKHPQTGRRLELHAMVHFGDASYYQGLDDDKEPRKVLYELLLDEACLETDPTTGQRRLGKTLVGSSAADQRTAALYDWACQVDVLPYRREGWIHADWTRQEFTQAFRAHTGQDERNTPREGAPLWQWTISGPGAATEVATALLVGPPTLAEDSRRRLFSNLFLPGSSLTKVLRLALWLTIPAPELSILLLDWSSTTATTPRRNGGNLLQASWSPVLQTVLQATLAGRLDVIRRLAFGQVLLTGSRPLQSASLAQSLLIQGRNAKALSVLDQELAADPAETTTFALVYGSSHCPDLAQGLRARGFSPITTTWRTAWTAALPSNTLSSRPLPPLWVLPVFFYVAVSGWDWLASWEAARQAEGAADLALLATSYGVRHLFLYVGLSKLVLDWQTPE